MVQAFQLGLLGDQAGLAVIVRLADVLRVLVPAGDVGGLPRLVQERGERLGRDADGTPQIAGAVALIDAAVLEPAAQALHNAADGLLRAVELLCFQRYVGGVDHLCVGGERAGGCVSAGFG